MVVSAVAQSSTTRPARITVTASASATISLSLCVISRIVVPRARRLRSVANSCSVSCGVSTAVGSSRIRMRAPRYSAFRISSRWRSPTGSSSTERVEAHLQAAVAHQRLQLGACLRARGGQMPAGLGAEQHVVECAEGVDQHEVLVHHADAERDRVARVADLHGLAVDLDRPAVGADQSRTGSTSACSCRRRSRRRCRARCRPRP